MFKLASMLDKLDCLFTRDQTRTSLRLLPLRTSSTDILPKALRRTWLVEALAEFVKVCSTTDIQQGKMKMVQLGTEKVCLANVNGKYHAIGDVCTHVGGPLSQGILTEHTVTCPWHGSQFDVTNGQVKRGPARMPEPVYEVKVDGTSVLVKPQK